MLVGWMDGGGMDGGRANEGREMEMGIDGYGRENGCEGVEVGYVSGGYDDGLVWSVRGGWSAVAVMFCYLEVENGKLLKEP